MCRCLRLSLIVENPQNRSRDLQVEAFWHFGGTFENDKQIQVFKFTEVVKEHVNQSQSLKDEGVMAIDVEWQSQGATVAGFNTCKPNGTWSEDTKYLVARLLKLRDQENVTMRLRLPCLETTVRFTLNYHSMLLMLIVLEQ